MGRGHNKGLAEWVHMALDVKPLSLVRRIVMILLMAGLLGLSLGFAQLLIQRRTRVVAFSVHFPAPSGVSEMPVNTSADDAPGGVLCEAVEKWPQGERVLHAFDIPQEPDKALSKYLEEFLDRVLPDPYRRAISLQPGAMGGFGGAEAHRKVGRGADSSFAIIRGVSVNGHIVAFCLSGDGLFTDADNAFFDAYCTQQVEIQFDPSGRKAP